VERATLTLLEHMNFTYGLVIQGPAFGQELEYGSVKPFYGIPTTLDNWISNDNADINKKLNPTIDL
jgi:hypothetical protein